MVNKGETSLPEAIDRTLKDFKVNDRLMRGVVIIFADNLKKNTKYKYHQLCQKALKMMKFMIAPSFLISRPDLYP